eukprot:NODE_496_length_887_cov_12.002618_g488_i0.p1 GENE.NODE_496_length_887_cov_12.002618_g488_i0~~NODE_496_length_887_cov_12.002618_g488_i0.p1  ORF type:complete len:246 (-),score=10.88 NODE_496_length_887_cov_12.002618_g488_i0:87-824(-)
MGDKAAAGKAAAGAAVAADVAKNRACCACCLPCLKISCITCGIVTSLAYIGGMIACCKGSRPQQTFSPGELCGECESKLAKWKCAECSEIYCDECNIKIHGDPGNAVPGRGHRGAHKAISAISGDLEFFDPNQDCGDCLQPLTNKSGRMFCADCMEVYCMACHTKVHAKGLRRAHRKFHKLLDVAEPRSIFGIDFDGAVDVQDMLRRFPSGWWDPGGPSGPEVESLSESDQQALRMFAARTQEKS